ncbi:MAG: DNA/RNA non-specific endonuclease [Lachnospiraceae bacterium]|nr:DNA/RNA non-specific endonuclease [Lachnospiraceae bacterium]
MASRIFTGKNHKKRKRAALIAAAAVILLAAYFGVHGFPFAATEENEIISALEIPEYAGEAWIEVNNNVPYFETSEMSTDSFESYSDLDDLGRCGAAFANISRELMPTEERGEIGSVQPSGWNQAKYEGVIDSNPAYLYNRCHLIAYCLTAENANEKNLITGTRYLNVEGMLPFENQVAKYLDENDNHVLYWVTPVFEDDNLLASGVLMEAYSVEDNGAGICFCVYCYNVQPGIAIDYSTGESCLAYSPPLPQIFPHKSV